MADNVFRGDIDITYDSAPLETAQRAALAFGAAFDQMVERIVSGQRKINEALGSTSQATNQTLQQTQRTLQDSERAFAEFHDRAPRLIRDAMREVDSALRGGGPNLSNSRVEEIRRETEEYRRALDERRRLFEQSRQLGEQFSQRGLAVPESIGALQRSLERPLDLKQLDGVVQKLQQIRANAQIIFRFDANEVNQALAPIVQAQERVRSLRGELESAKRERDRIINQNLGAEIKPQEIGNLDAWRKAMALYVAEIEQAGRRMPRLLKEIMADLDSPQALEKLPQTIEKAMRFANQGKIRLNLDLTDLQQADKYLGSLDGMKARVMALMESFQQANRTVPEFLNRFWAQLNDPKPADNLEKMARQLLAFEQANNLRMTFRVDDAGQVERLATRTQEIQAQLAKPVLVSVRDEGLNQTAQKAKEATAAVTALGGEAKKLGETKPMSLGLDSLIRQAETFGGKMRDLRSLVTALRGEIKAQAGAGAAASPEFSAFLADFSAPGRKSAAQYGPRLQQLAAEQKLVAFSPPLAAAPGAPGGPAPAAPAVPTVVKADSVKVEGPAAPTGGGPTPTAPAAPAVVRAETVRVEGPVTPTGAPAPAAAAAKLQPQPAALTSLTIGQINVPQLLIDAQRVTLVSGSVTASGASGAGRPGALSAGGVGEGFLTPEQLRQPTPNPELVAQRDEIRQQYQLLDDLKRRTTALGETPSAARDTLLDQQMQVLNRIQDLEAAQEVGAPERAVRAMAQQVMAAGQPSRYVAYEDAIEVFRQAREQNLPPDLVFQQNYGARLAAAQQAAAQRAAQQAAAAPPVPLPPAAAPTPAVMARPLPEILPPPAPLPQVLPPPASVVPSVPTPRPLPEVLGPPSTAPVTVSAPQVVVQSPDQVVTQPPRQAAPPPAPALPTLTAGGPVHAPPPAVAEAARFTLSAAGEEMARVLQQALAERGEFPENAETQVVAKVYAGLTGALGRTPGLETIREAVAAAELGQFDESRMPELMQRRYGSELALRRTQAGQAEAARRAQAVETARTSGLDRSLVEQLIGFTGDRTSFQTLVGRAQQQMAERGLLQTPSWEEFFRDVNSSALESRFSGLQAMARNLALNRNLYVGQQRRGLLPGQPAGAPPEFSQALAAGIPRELMEQAAEFRGAQGTEREFRQLVAALEAARAGSGQQASGEFASLVRQAASPEVFSSYPRLQRDLRQIAETDALFYARPAAAAQPAAPTPRFGDIETLSLADLQEFGKTFDEGVAGFKIFAERLQQVKPADLALAPELVEMQRKAADTSIPLNRADISTLVRELAAQGRLLVPATAAAPTAEAAAGGPSLEEMRAFLAQRAVDQGAAPGAEQVTALLARTLEADAGKNLPALQQEFAQLRAALTGSGMAQAVAQGVTQGAQQAGQQAALPYIPATAAKTELLVQMQDRQESGRLGINETIADFQERQVAGINRWLDELGQAFGSRGMTEPTLLAKVRDRWVNQGFVPTEAETTKLGSIMPTIDQLTQRVDALLQKYTQLGQVAPTGLATLQARLTGPDAWKVAMGSGPQAVSTAERVFDTRFGAQLQQRTGAPAPELAAAAREIEQYKQVTMQAAAQLQDMGRSAERAYSLLRLLGRTDAPKHMDEIRLKVRDLGLEMQRSEQEMAQRAEQERRAAGGSGEGRGGGEFGQMATQQLEYLARSFVPYRWQGVVDLAFRFGRLTLAVGTVVAALHELNAGMEAVQQREATLFRLGSVFQNPEATAAALQQSLGGRITETQATTLMSQVDRNSVLAVGDNMEQLAKVAQARATATGASFEQTFAAISQAIRSGNGAFLEQNRIIESATDAFLQYAQSIGKAPGALTETERQMALLNATLAQNAEFLAKPQTALEQMTASGEGFRAALANMRQEYKLWLGTMTTGPGGTGGIAGAYAEGRGFLTAGIEGITDLAFTNPRKRKEMTDQIADPIQRQVYDLVRKYFDQIVVDQADYAAGKGLIDRMGLGNAPIIGDLYETVLAKNEMAIRDAGPIMAAIDKQIQVTGGFDISQVEPIIGILDDISSTPERQSVIRGPQVLGSLRQQLGKLTPALAEPFVQENIQQLLDTWEQEIVGRLNTQAAPPTGVAGAIAGLFPRSWQRPSGEAEREQLAAAAAQVTQARETFAARGRLTLADLGPELRAYIGDVQARRVGDTAARPTADTAYTKVIDLLTQNLQQRLLALQFGASEIRPGTEGAAERAEIAKQAMLEIQTLQQALQQVNAQYDKTFRFDPRLITEQVQKALPPGALQATGFNMLPEVVNIQEIQKLRKEAEDARVRADTALRASTYGEDLLGRGEISRRTQVGIRAAAAVTVAQSGVAEAQVPLAEAQAQQAAAYEWGTREEQLLADLAVKQAQAQAAAAEQTLKHAEAVKTLSEAEGKLADVQAAPPPDRDQDAVTQAQRAYEAAKSNLALIESGQKLVDSQKAVAAATATVTKAQMDYLLVTSRPGATVDERTQAAQAYDLAQANLEVVQARQQVNAEQEKLNELTARRDQLSAGGHPEQALTMAQSIEDQQVVLDAANAYLVLAQNMQQTAQAAADGTAKHDALVASLEAGTSALARYSAANIAAQGSLAGFQPWATAGQVAGMGPQAISDFYGAARGQSLDYFYARAAQAPQMAMGLVGRMGWQGAMGYVTPFQTRMAETATGQDQFLAAIKNAGIMPNQLAADPAAVAAAYADASAARTQAAIADQTAALSRALSGQPSANERALKSLENAIRGMIPGATPVTTKGLWTEELTKKAEQLGLKPREEEADEIARQALDVFKMGTKSPNWEQVKPFVPAEVMAGGEEAIVKWAGQQVIDWEAGRPTALISPHDEAVNVLEQLKKQEAANKRQDEVWAEVEKEAAAQGISMDTIGEMRFGKEQWAEMKKEPAIPSQLAGFQSQEAMDREFAMQQLDLLTRGGASPEQIRSVLANTPDLMAAIQKYNIPLQPEWVPETAKPFDVLSGPRAAPSLPPPGARAGVLSEQSYKDLYAAQQAQMARGGKSAAATVAEGDEGETQAALKDSADEAVATTAASVEEGAETVKTQTKNPAVTLTEVTPEDLQAIKDGGIPVADAFGQGILNQFITEADYPGQLLTQFLAGFQGDEKMKKIQEGGAALADWFGGAMTKRFGEKVPADLLSILTDNLVPLIVQRMAEEAGRYPTQPSGPQ